MTANVKAIRVDGKTWHGREPEFSDGYIQVGERPSEAMGMIGTLDMVTQKTPTMIEINGVQTPTGDFKLVQTNVPWNDEGYEILNRTVNNYHPIQNRQLGEIFDPLSDTYQLATVGNIGVRGQISFIEFKDGEFTIGGNDNELHKPYLLIGDNKESKGTYVGYVTTRVVCENTWTMAIGGIKPIPHSHDSVQILDYIAHIQYQVVQHRAEEIAMLNKMFNTPLRSGDMNDIAKKVFPEVRKSNKLQLFESSEQYRTQAIVPIMEKEVGLFEKSVQRIEKRRIGLVEELFKFNDEHSHAANTAYAALNAVTGYVNHSNDFNGQGTDVVANLMFGNRTQYQQDGWNACVEIVK